MLYPGNTEHYSLRLVYSKNDDLVEIEAGPALEEQVVDEIAALIQNELLQRCPDRIANAVLFSAIPLTRAYRFGNEFQILPVPDDLPQLQEIGGPNPFLLEFRIRGSVAPEIESIRSKCRRNELALLLGATCVRQIDRGVPTMRQWVIPQTKLSPRRDSVAGYTGYLSAKLLQVSDNFTNITNYKTVPQLNLNKYYQSFGMDNEGTLALPEGIDAAVTNYFALPDGSKKKFLSAAYWLVHSRAIEQFSFSASLVALVSAIEKLMPESEQAGKCGTCNKTLGKGPTRRFKEFVERFAPVDSGADKEDYYSLRSRLVHGGFPFRSDVGLSDGADSDFFVAMVRHHYLGRLVQSIILNWLLARGPERDAARS
jgi:hypothetical protein